METVEINIRRREGRGSGKAGRLRRTGVIPGVLYGGGNENAISVEVDQLVFDHKIASRGSSQIYILQSDDQQLGGQMALVRDLQLEPIKGKPLHIDFLALETGEAVLVTVQLKIIGECPAVKLGEAVLSQALNEVDVECLPQEIPSEITVDVSGLEIGDTFAVGDLQLPEGVEVRTDKSVAIITAVSKKRLAEAAAAEEAEAAGEGAEAGAEAGAAAAGESSE